MRQITAILLVGYLMACCSGCSIYHAMSGPSAINFDHVKVGEKRSQFIAALGMPKNTERNGDTRTDLYEFTDGYAAGSKFRILLYIGGDVVTAGLSELLFWPIELAAGHGVEGIGSVEYNKNDIATSVLLTKKDGTAWVFEKAPSNVLTSGEKNETYSTAN